jgi:hypothetical protein
VYLPNAVEVLQNRVAAATASFSICHSTFFIGHLLNVDFSLSDFWCEELEAGHFSVHDDKGKFQMTNGK